MNKKYIYTSVAVIFAVLNIVQLAVFCGDQKPVTASGSYDLNTRKGLIAAARDKSFVKTKKAHNELDSMETEGRSDILGMSMMMVR